MNWMQHNFEVEYFLLLGMELNLSYYLHLAVSVRPAVAILKRS